MLLIPRGMNAKPLVLILCTGNSCRSHLAEGILRAASADLIEVASAGSKPSGFVHSKSIEVMKELGIDISDHRSKHLDEFLNRQVDTVNVFRKVRDQIKLVFEAYAAGIKLGMAAR